VEGEPFGQAMAESTEVEGAKIIDGKAIAQLIHDSIREEIIVLKEKYGKVSLSCHLLVAIVPFY
jgi:hypothetical protein